jgi:hypothetical protein
MAQKVAKIKRMLQKHSRPRRSMAAIVAEMKAGKFIRPARELDNWFKAPPIGKEKW